MTQKSYIARGALYFLVAALPIASAGMAAHLAWHLVAINALAAGLTAVRAFIDKSPSEYHDAEKATQTDAA